MPNALSITWLLKMFWTIVWLIDCILKLQIFLRRWPWITEPNPWLHRALASLPARLLPQSPLPSDPPRSAALSFYTPPHSLSCTPFTISPFIFLTQKIISAFGVQLSDKRPRVYIAVQSQVTHHAEWSNILALLPKPHRWPPLPQLSPILDDLWLPFGLRFPPHSCLRQGDTLHSALLVDTA